MGGPAFPRQSGPWLPLGVSVAEAGPGVAEAKLAPAGDGAPKPAAGILDGATDGVALQPAAALEIAAQVAVGYRAKGVECGTVEIR